MHVDLRTLAFSWFSVQTVAVGQGQAGRASRTNRQSGVISLDLKTLTMHGCSSILALNTLQFGERKINRYGNAKYRHECAPARAALPCQSVCIVVRPPSEVIRAKGAGCAHSWLRPA
eukprot:COSAG04_NODE_1705_length_5881_cov_13.667935_5_plen_117_part_00